MLRFLPDGLHVVSGHADGTLRTWDLTDLRTPAAELERRWLHRLGMRFDGARITSDPDWAPLLSRLHRRIQARTLTSRFCSTAKIACVCAAPSRSSSAIAAGRSPAGAQRDQRLAVLPDGLDAPGALLTPEELRTEHPGRLRPFDQLPEPVEQALLEFGSDLRVHDRDDARAHAALQAARPAL